MGKSESASPEGQTRARARRIVGVLAKTYPDATCALHHQNAYQLLAATILSAQCTDERVNKVTPELFARYPEPADLAAANQEDVEEIIRTCGFFRAKSNSLRGMARKLTDDFHGEVPRTVDEMTKLPGVGRKTANVVLGTVYGLSTGVVVDTHVTRITRLLGLTANTDAVKIEQDLMGLLPESEWIDFSHRLIHHGRQICIARRPRCSICPLLELCPRIGLEPMDAADEPSPAPARKSRNSPVKAVVKASRKGKRTKT